ncbi:hypothetical protein [Candidatus Poriferisodalis sp.]|uniref:hypothetical protein n=1 Tax=Candidatus Poriferisodalis sp. TaxID=3101277 RepID=UPI003B5ABB13
MSGADIHRSGSPVVYRAMWNDDRPGLHELAARSFRNWATWIHPQLGGGDFEPAEQHPPEGADERNGSAGSGSGNADAVRVNLRRETAAHGGVSETLLELEQEAPESQSIVVLRVLTNGREGWVWVDVQMPTDQPAASSASGVHELVCALLDDAEAGGGRPRLGGERIGTRPIAVEPTRQQVVPLAERLTGSSREVPYVVIAHDYLDGPGPTMARARTTARQLAGLARVYVLPAQTINPFQVVMGADLGVQPGEARLYLPGEHEPHRHRTLAAEMVRSDPTETGRWFGRLLQSTLVAKEPPELYRRSQQLLGERRELLEPSPDTDAAERVEALETEVEAVWKTLYQTREERSASRAECDELAQQILDMQEELELAQLRAEELQETLIDKEHKMVEVLVRAGEAGVALDIDASGKKYPQVTSVRQALKLARANLLKVEIPPEAEARVVELDNAIEARSWARSVFDGLLALEAYAHSGVGFGDFREWCKSSKHPRAWYANSKKLAMRESEEVMRRSELSRLRDMPVSLRVRNSGRITMEAHLKLSNGSLAPRLYFYDDTGSNTGKVHVGYIGPHLPTKRFRS